MRKVGHRRRGGLFQALIAGAARGAGLPPEDELALKWLERLGPPRIVAPVVRRGRAVKLYVPNNDLDSVGGDPARVAEIRVLKQWRPSFFDPNEPVLYLWDFESGSIEATRICAIAARMYQLGRGIDMAWACGQVLERNEAEARLESHPGTMRRPGGAGETATPHAGTLDSLVNRYQRKTHATDDRWNRSQDPAVVCPASQGVLPQYGIRHPAASPSLRTARAGGRLRSSSPLVRGALGHRIA